MKYKIPLFDLNYDEREAKAAYDVIKSGWISTGPKCKEFEDKFSEMLGCKYAVSLANCTAALHLALIILGIKQGDEVIVPSLTFVATANAVRYVGANPVFADVVSSDNLTIDPEDVRAKVTTKTKAIIVMHYAGFPCLMDEIMEIAQKHNLKVMEDACHGPLSEYRGRKLGTIGDIGCFSFFSNKNISTGEGGMLVTNNEEYANQARLFRSHGMTTMSYDRAKGHASEYDVITLGYNYRLDDIHAAIGIVQLDKLHEDIHKRSKVRKWYIDRLAEIDKIIVPFKDNKETTSNYIFSIVINDLNKQRVFIRDHLHNTGIQTSVHYTPVHRLKIYQSFISSCPRTDKVCERLVSLPMYSSLDKNKIKYIAESLRMIL